MDKNRINKRNFMVTGGLLLSFIIYTLLIKFVDVQAIGPEGSKVGFATLNQWEHNLLGVHMLWYNITKYSGAIVILVALGFAGLGGWQLFKRKDLFKVDKDLIILGMFYVLVGFAYVFFELCIVNYRPVMIGGELEASYPSSHSMLAICIMGSAILQIDRRIKDETVKKGLTIVCLVIMGITIIGRLISGVHWLTDILGGILLGCTLTMFYYSVMRYIFPKRNFFKREKEK